MAAHTMQHTLPLLCSGAEADHSHLIESHPVALSSPASDGAHSAAHLTSSDTSREPSFSQQKSMLVPAHSESVLEQHAADSHSNSLNAGPLCPDPHAHLDGTPAQPHSDVADLAHAQPQPQPPSEVGHALPQPSQAQQHATHNQGQGSSPRQSAIYKLRSISVKHLITPKANPTDTTPTSGRPVAGAETAQSNRDLCSPETGAGKAAGALPLHVAGMSGSNETGNAGGALLSPRRSISLAKLRSQSLAKQPTAPHTVRQTVHATATSTAALSETPGPLIKPEAVSLRSPQRQALPRPEAGPALAALTKPSVSHSADSAAEPVEVTDIDVVMLPGTSEPAVNGAGTDMHVATATLLHPVTQQQGANRLTPGAHPVRVSISATDTRASLTLEVSEASWKGQASSSAVSADQRHTGHAVTAVPLHNGLQLDSHPAFQGPPDSTLASNGLHLAQDTDQQRQQADRQLLAVSAAALSQHPHNPADQLDDSETCNEAIASLERGQANEQLLHDKKDPASSPARRGTSGQGLLGKLEGSLRNLLFKSRSQPVATSAVRTHDQPMTCKKQHVLRPQPHIHSRMVQ